MTRLALFGYGQMGQLLEKLAPQHDCQIVAIYDPNTDLYNRDIEDHIWDKIDVCLDFSLPEKVLTNTEMICMAGKNLVIGTTGWYDNLSIVENIVQQYNMGMIYGGNFSLGMNLFFLITGYASQLIGETGIYDVFGCEMHHNKKADSPSGTARELAEIVLSNFPSKKTVQYECLNRRIDPDEFHFASVRGGSIPGTHIVGYDSPFDTIELKHTARSREGFAVGALKAAQWIKDKKGVYEFQEIFADLIKK